ncbi:MAG TPA: type VII secretion protein EccCb [Candidatus Lustribacter sp.]|nr:type VII secretion protein EccCb [Candidatus Lustribacter sp.]
MTVLTIGGTPPPASDVAPVLVLGTGRDSAGGAAGEVSLRVIPAGGEPVDGWADQLSIAGADALARRLAAWGRDERPRGRTGDGVSPELVDLLGLGDLRRLRLSRAWAPRGARDRLRVPIGVDDAGAPVWLDLKEAAEHGMGPHGLLIGATGSGKSELLRTVVVGLALTHSPEDLNLVLVDFKGGATFAGLAGMPHVSAVITNLREELTLVDRMYDALSGEMLRRQQVLRAAGNVASLRDYNAARSAGRALDPLPTLVIVCDEFTELLTAQPEFTELFVAMGRLGRSLGIHLLLASQRLEEGRLRGLDSHLSYRIALRTFSASESRAVIGEPDAYVLASVPGLGYLKPGPSTRVRFRATYVSGPAGAAERTLPNRAVVTPIVPFRVGEVRALPGALARGPAGDTLVRRSRKANSDRPARACVGPTVVDLAVSAMSGQGPEAHRVWLTPLGAPDTFDTLLPDLIADPERGLHSPSWRARGPLRVPLGAVDRPKDQRRDILVADLSGPGGHVAVVGGPQTGKSTVLRSLVAGLALTHTPREVQVFVLDFGGGTVAGLRDLAHVAGVATRSEPDVVRRICAEVATIADERERYFRSAGIDSIAAYRSRRAAGAADDGYGDVVLVVDGWATLRAELDGLEAELQALAERALTYGVHLLTSTTRWLDYRASMRDLLGTRVELKLGDAMDSEVDRKLAAAVPGGRPGRAITPEGFHVLTALPRLDGAADPATLAAGVEHLVSAVNDAWTGPPGPKLRLLPDTVSLSDLRSCADEPTSGRLLVGLTERSLRPVGLDLGEEPHLLVYGDGRSGKSAFLRSYVRELERLSDPGRSQLFVVDVRRAHLGEYDDAWVAAYCTTAGAAASTMTELASYLGTRLPGPGVTAAQLRARSWWTGREVYVLVDDYELVASAQPNPLAPLLALLPQARDVGLHLVLARRTGGAGRSFDPVSQALRDLGSPGLILSGDPAEGALLGGVRPSLSAPGRARLVRRDGVQVVQLAWSPPGGVPEGTQPPRPADRAAGHLLVSPVD